MKITIELSTGKKIELTQAEFNELFNRIPAYYPTWPRYMTPTGDNIALYKTSDGTNTALKCST
jgi:hypothetical protein